MKRFRKIINRFPKARIGVIGDMTADIYIYGKPYRLSREAPVIVVHYDYEELIPGGAANTVYNLIDLGAQVYPISVLGNDEAGKKLLSFLSLRCQHTEGIILDPECHTILKTRIMAGDDNTTKQQVIRIDRDPKKKLSDGNQPRILSYLSQIAPSLDALIISDYGYGMCNRTIREFIKRFSKEKIVVVDSRYHIGAFTGATIVTPNLSEAEHFTGIKIKDDKTLQLAGNKILRTIKARAALITRGNKGMTLFERGSPPLHIPVYGSDQISDVTGAGDTVCALVALSLVAGASFADTAKLANCGASVVVMKPGTATVNQEELIAALSNAPLS